MNFHMTNKSPGLCKSRVALGALVWFFTRVYSHMVCEIYLNGESGVTLRTLVWFFTGM